MGRHEILVAQIGVGEIKTRDVNFPEFLFLDTRILNLENR